MGGPVALGGSPPVVGGPIEEEADGLGGSPRQWGGGPHASSRALVLGRLSPHLSGDLGSPIISPSVEESMVGVVWRAGQAKSCLVPTSTCGLTRTDSAKDPFKAWIRSNELHSLPRSQAIIVRAGLGTRAELGAESVKGPEAWVTKAPGLLLLPALR